MLDYFDRYREEKTMVECRVARQEDLEACFALRGKGGIFQYYFRQERTFENVIRKALISGNLYVAIWKETETDEEGNIAGLMIIKRKAFCDLYDYLSLLCVGEKFRKLGIGSALLSYAEKDAADQGCETFSLEVRVSNAPARHLYEKHGFIQVNIRKGYYENGEDAYLMVKPIGGQKDDADIRN